MGDDMSLLDRLSQESTWRSFIEYRSRLAVSKGFVRELCAFADSRAYLPVCEAIEAGGEYPLPRRSVISKLGTEKKRVVYTYPDDWNTVIKLLTYLMIRKYDGLFSDGLYSFRAGRTAKDAVRRLTRTKGIWDMCSYKVDVSNYFNSVPTSQLVPMMQSALADDPRLAEFLKALLEEPCVLDGGERIREEKGIMAGTPLSAFYADLYLSELDRHFAELGVPYARYSDDIIVFGQTQQETERHAEFIRGFLAKRGLKVNPAKESFTAAGESWCFLGFVCSRERIDIAPATVKKLKQKMRRKTRALSRWSSRTGAGGEKAAAAFIRIFDRKLLQSPHDNELSWSCWFFSVITTPDTLHELDRYAQDCVRYLITGSRTKSRFNARYGDLKRLGLRSLVAAYYSDGTDSAPKA